MSFFGKSSLSVPQLTATNNLLTADSIPRVSVWAGATSGIGLATLQSFTSRGQPFKAYVIGRDEARLKPALDALRASNDKAEIVFVEGQVSLLRDVQRICDVIAAEEDSIDALFLSQGYLPFNGRVETEEGLERCLAVTYYSKIAFAKLLMPLLRQAAHPRIVAIVAAGQEVADIPLDDIDFEKPGRFGPMAIARQGSTMITLALDRIARDEPHVVVIHAHPGSVATGVLSRGEGGGLKHHLLRWVVEPIVSLGSFTPAQSGERSLYLLTSSTFGGSGTPLPAGRERGVNVDSGVDGGAVFLADMQMNTVRQEKVLAELRERKADQVVWEHTINVLKRYLPGI